jgi:hypothetical protein
MAVPIALMCGALIMERFEIGVLGLAAHVDEETGAMALRAGPAPRTADRVATTSTERPPQNAIGANSATAA